MNCKLMMHGTTMLLAAVCAAGVFAQDNRDAREAAGHGWVTNYETARAVARRDGKPLMVVFRCVP